MKTQARTLIAAVCAAALLSPALFAADAVQAPAATVAAAPQAAPNYYPKQVEVDFVQQYAVLPRPPGVTIVDARPAARKYDIGHIPGAVNIPDSQFDRLASTLLPKDKAQLLIFYCDGPACMLSHNSAYKAQKLGYTNIRVYTAGFPDWVKHGNLHAVSVAHLKRLLDASTPLTLVDARPKERKYDRGHIPGAISLPDSQFDKLAAERLPADRAAPLFFYCDGLACKLSNDSARKAIALGYTNVKVVPEGYPGWEAAYGAGITATATAAAPATVTPAAAAAAPVLVAGKEPGTVAVASFEQIFRQAPQSVYLVDVRSPQEFASGTFKGAINMPIDTLEQNIDKLPSDKPIIFFCGAGGRSGEAHDMAKMYRPQLKTVFLDATIQWTAAGDYTIASK